jgi:hypothetical protein
LNGRVQGVHGEHQEEGQSQSANDRPMKFNVIHANGSIKIKISQVTVTYCMMERRSKKHLFTANPSEVTHRATGIDFSIDIIFRVF